MGIILPDAPVNLYHLGVDRSFWSHLKKLPLWTPAARVLSLSCMWLVHPSDPLNRKIHMLKSKMNLQKGIYTQKERKEQIFVISVFKILFLVFSLLVN